MDMRQQIINIRKEVKDLISINERIQSAFLRGEHITPDETALINLTARELLGVSEKLGTRELI